VDQHLGLRRWSSMPNTSRQPHRGPNVDVDGFQTVVSHCHRHSSWKSAPKCHRPVPPELCGSLLQLSHARPYHRSVSLPVLLLSLQEYWPSGQGVQAWSFAGMHARLFAGMRAFILGGASPRTGCQGASPCWSIVVARRLRRARTGADTVVALSLQQSTTLPLSPIAPQQQPDAITTSG
jgi:hypothetical protein